MGLFNSLLQKFTFSRDNEGNYSYFSEASAFGSNKKFLEWSLENPVLFACVATRAKAFSQMKVSVLDRNGDVVDTPELDLINKPNYFQTRQDFLYQFMWFMSVAGENFIYKIQPLSTQLPKALFNLQPSCIDFEKANKIDPFIFRKNEKKLLDDVIVKYTTKGQTKDLRLKDLNGFYDVANGLTEDSYYNSPSRIKSIERTLQNIDENIKSKNINLKFSQKFLVTNSGASKGAMPQIQPEDRKNILSTLMGNSVQVTNADVQANHLVSDLKRLYLDEQLAADANTVALAFEMNKDIMNYFLGKSSTYENQEQGIIRYIQNSIQSSADALMEGLSDMFNLQDKGLRLVATFDHLPVMQSVLNTKLKTFNESQVGIKEALENGTITDEEAKEMTKNVRDKINL